MIYLFSISFLFVIITIQAFDSDSNNELKDENYLFVPNNHNEKRDVHNNQAERTLHQLMNQSKSKRRERKNLK